MRPGPTARTDEVFVQPQYHRVVQLREDFNLLRSRWGQGAGDKFLALL